MTAASAAEQPSAPEFESIADNIDSAIDAIAPVIGFFVPYAAYAKPVADGLDGLMHELLDSAPAGANPASLAKLEASLAQLAAALKQGQKGS